MSAPRACPGLPVAVVTASAADAATACEGARDALGFLLPVGLQPPDRTIVVEIVEALPEGLRKEAVGCYAVGSRRVMVITPEPFLQRGTWFGVAVSRTLWRSVITHEVAHALVGCNVGARTISGAAHEYVAYVTMFATMDAATREKALAHLPGEGFDHPMQINGMIYAFDPMLFGAESYRHWLRQPDGAAFLRRVVDGSAIQEPAID